MRAGLICLKALMLPCAGGTGCTRIYVALTILA